MELPEEVRDFFVRHGRRGGRTRARRLSPSTRKAIARQAATRRWIRARFGAPGFAVLGLPGGEVIDRGLDALAAGAETMESLAVSLAAPRLRREGVPVRRKTIPDADHRLYRLLEEAHGALAHARYLAHLRELASFADACRVARERHAR